jgi:phosphate transport system substrate-binding protein
MYSMRRAAVVPGLLLVSVWLALGCASVNADQGTAKGTTLSPGKLLITGSSTMAPVVSEIAKRFQTMHSGIEFEVQTGGSGRGISDIMQGKADIGMASRALTDKESSLYSFAIARDGICLIIHKDNPVQSLTNQQVANIYTGKIANWNKVGGRNAPITVTTPGEGYAAVELFAQFFKIKYSEIKAQKVLGDNLERIKTIAQTPDGVSYVSLGVAEREAAAGVPVKLLPVDGVAPTRKNIRSGNFPISRPLILLTKQQPAGLIKEFINFSLSSQATDIIEKYDFVPYLD